MIKYPGMVPPPRIPYKVLAFRVTFLNRTALLCDITFLVYDRKPGLSIGKRLESSAVKIVMKYLHCCGIHLNKACEIFTSAIVYFKKESIVWVAILISDHGTNSILSQDIHQHPTIHVFNLIPLNQKVYTEPHWSSHLTLNQHVESFTTEPTCSVMNRWTTCLDMSNEPTCPVITAELTGLDTEQWTNLPSHLPLNQDV